MADFLLGGADWQIDCQHESRLADEIYRCMNLVTVGKTVCATEPPIKGCTLRLMKLICVVY